MTSADSQAAHVRDVAAAGGIVDSILPMPEMLRRFQASALTRPDSFAHASASRDALVARFAAAVATRDTTELNAMLLDRAEFAWLYFPTSRVSKPPYEAPPGLVWDQLLASSNQGAASLLRVFGGKRLDVESTTCPQPLVIEGDNRVFENCAVQVRVDGATRAPTQLFGPIVERGGRFKFLGFGNRL